MKTLYESLLDDETVFIKKAEKSLKDADFYLQCINYIKKQGKVFHPIHIYNTLLETTWAKRDWIQYFYELCKSFKSDFKGPEDPKAKTIVGYLKFLHHMRDYNWFISSIGSNSIQPQGFPSHKIIKGITDEQLEELATLGIYFSGADNHNPKKSHNVEEWIHYWDENCLCHYVIWIDKRMTPQEKKVLKVILNAVEKSKW